MKEKGRGVATDEILLLHWRLFLGLLPVRSVSVSVYLSTSLPSFLSLHCCLEVGTYLVLVCTRLLLLLGTARLVHLVLERKKKDIDRRLKTDAALSTSAHAPRRDQARRLAV